jgi:hypothetical protein
MHKDVRQTVIALVGVAAAALLTTGAAAAGPVNHGRVASVAGSPGAAGSIVGLPDGSRVVLPEDFTEMTVDQLAQLGIVPGMGSAPEVALIAPNDTAPTGSSDGAALLPAADDGRATSRDASGCNQRVCQQVQASGGKGLNITGWFTWVESFPVSTCTFAAFWEGGSITSTTTQVCGEAGKSSSLASKGGLPRKFANNTQVCTTWANISGKPCHTVHS